MDRVVEPLLWWAVLVGTWLLTLSTFPVAELVAGAVAALPCAVAAGAARRAVDGRWRVRRRWLRWLVRLPVAVVADAVRVLALPLRRRSRLGSGRIRTVRLDPDGGAPAEDAHRALATAVVSMAPGSVVVDDRPGERALVLHSLVEGPPQLDAAVRS
jgi:multisubunit Na+/H+ antiporter MnhE subunit